MKHRNMAPAHCRQLNLDFEPRLLEGLDEMERQKAASMLVQILMQAAGLVVEGLGDDQY
ncbi:MAG: hypothetical protein LBE86_15035 [Gemmobacter sp.]|nr:hypothetical protein [Gemmobacter sp.]